MGRLGGEMRLFGERARFVCDENPEVELVVVSAERAADGRGGGGGADAAAVAVGHDECAIFLGEQFRECGMADAF
jgi:hypothetical protein